MLESRTEGALAEEISRPHGRPTRAQHVVVWLARGIARFLWLARGIARFLWLARGIARFDRRSGVALALACVPTLAGCSAVAALAETHRAERALVSSHGLRPTPAATYALTVSRAYLDKAREEASEAHYGRAVAYARAATEAANDAQRTQLERVTSSMVPAPRRARSNEGEGSR